METKTPSPIEIDKAAVIKRFGRYVSSGKAAFFQNSGVEFVPGRREGPIIWDIDGEKQLIDCHCNGGVFNFGHRHPEMVATLQQSLDAGDIGNHLLMSAARAELAERLAQLTPGDLNYTVFGVSGGEAVDLAIKVARGFTGRQQIITARGGYHGHTGLALAAGDEKYYRSFGGPATGFLQVPFNDLAALEATVSRETAAILLETIPATSGILVPHPEYLPGLRRLCDDRGILLILDEIQAGLGRTGRLWGCQHFKVTPDIMVLGKGLSGGVYPISATCLRPDLESVFHDDPFVHISTFGGAEPGCWVALRVLDMTADPAFLAHVREMAAVFAEGFNELETRHASVLVRLRQLGLMMGIEMVHEACGPLFARAAYENGLLCVYAGNDSRVAQLLPPLITDRALATTILARADRALAQVAELSPLFT